MNENQVCVSCHRQIKCFPLRVCQHAACRECWTSWILQEITSKRDFIVCLSTRCKVQVTDTFIKQMLPEDVYLTKVVQPVPNLIELFASLVQNPHVCTNMDYFHYMCSGENDFGWGCAYRACQMILSCLIKCGAIPQLESVPSIGELQMELARIGRFSVKHIFSHQWIEPPDVGEYLRKVHKLKTEECVFDTNKDSLNELTERLKQHFKTHHTPVMIDDTLKAYTLVGYGEVLLGSQTQPLLLRFDPHLFLYTKFEDYQQWVQQSGQRIDKIPEQGGVQWLTPTEIFISQRRSNRWLILFSFKEHITDV